MWGIESVRRTAVRGRILLPVAAAGIAGALVPVAAAGAPRDQAAAAGKTLLTYRLDAEQPYITLKILTTGRAVIVDQEKPAVYHFTLTHKQLSDLKARIANAHVNTLKHHYSNTGPPIACGTPFQTLTVNGRTITIDSGPPPGEPARLHQLLQPLANEINEKDPVPIPGKHIARAAQRCSGGIRS